MIDAHRDTSLPRIDMTPPRHLSLASSAQPPRRAFLLYEGTRPMCPGWDDQWHKMGEVLAYRDGLFECKHVHPTHAPSGFHASHPCGRLWYGQTGWRDPEDGHSMLMVAVDRKELREMRARCKSLEDVLRFLGIRP